MPVVLVHHGLSRIDIEINIMNDIVCAGGVESLIAGVKIIPHMISAEKLVKLSAGQMLCVFVLLGTENHKFTLS